MVSGIRSARSYQLSRQGNLKTLSSPRGMDHYDQEPLKRPKPHRMSERRLVFDSLLPRTDGGVYFVGRRKARAGPIVISTVDNTPGLSTRSGFGAEMIRS